MAGLTISVGGRLDPSFAAAINKARQMGEAEAGKLRAQAARASLLGEKNTAVHLEQERYQQWLQSNIGTLKTVNDLRRDEAQSTLAASAALKSLNSELQENKRLQAISGARESGVAGSVARQNYQDFWMANTAADPTKNEKIKAYFERKKAATGYTSMGAGISPGFASYMAKEAEMAAVPALSKVGVKAGAAAGQSFLARMLAALGGHEGKMGMMQLVHTGRATFDALVAGISPWRVFLYEMPQLLQSITLIGGSALKVLMSIAAVGGSIAAIIAAPFLYLWRVSAIADRLSKFKLPDLDTGYIARVDTLAESYRKIANAIRDTVNQYNSATAAAERANKAMEAQFQLQSELDTISKERAIQAAMGDKNRIAAIEKQYEQLAIQRESEKLDAEKASKVAERAALEKEISEKRKQIAEIKFGGDAQHGRVTGDLEKQYEAARKLIADNASEKSMWQSLKEKFSRMTSSGALVGMVSPVFWPAAANSYRKQGLAESDSTKHDLENAQNIVAQYLKLKNLEQARTDAIKEREKLQSDVEKKGQRYAELTMQINDSEKEKAQILARMNTLAGAKAGQTDQNARFGGGGGAASVTERERIGLGAASSIQVSILDVARKQHTTQMQSLTQLQEIVKQLQEGGW